MVNPELRLKHIFLSGHCLLFLHCLLIVVNGSRVVSHSMERIIWEDQ